MLVGLLREEGTGVGFRVSGVRMLTDALRCTCPCLLERSWSFCEFLDATNVVRKDTDGNRVFLWGLKWRNYPGVKGLGWKPL